MTSRRRLVGAGRRLGPHDRPTGPSPGPPRAPFVSPNYAMGTFCAGFSPNSRRFPPVTQCITRKPRIFCWRVKSSPLVIDSGTGVRIGKPESGTGADNRSRKKLRNNGRASPPSLQTSHTECTRHGQRKKRKQNQLDLCNRTGTPT
jgi:hypothetical protein